MTVVLPMCRAPDTVGVGSARKGQKNVARHRCGCGHRRSTTRVRTHPPYTRRAQTHLCSCLALGSLRTRARLEDDAHRRILSPAVTMRRNGAYERPPEDGVIAQCIWRPSYYYCGATGPEDTISQNRGLLPATPGRVLITRRTRSALPLGPSAARALPGLRLAGAAYLARRRPVPAS